MKVLALPLNPPLSSPRMPRADPPCESDDNWLEALGLISPTDRRIVELLLDGVSFTKDFSRALKMTPRTVKSHFNRLYLRFGVRNGHKKVRLAVLLYRAARQNGVGCGLSRPRNGAGLRTRAAGDLPPDRGARQSAIHG
jgi:DNA-binding CsgD family transcriptional regulator